MNLYSFLAVGIGGMIGSITRFLIGKSIDEKFGSTFPYGTLTVNFIGSLILGVVIGVSMRKTGLNENWRLFLGTGFCGGFTTFSAFSLENFFLLHQKPALSFLYIGLSLAAGLSAVAIGYFAGKSF